MTKRGKSKRSARLPNNVSVSTPVDGSVDQTPVLNRQSRKRRSSQTAQASSAVTHVVVPASIRIAAMAILRDYRKRFGLEGPDSDYLEHHDDGAITVHHSSRWKKRRAKIKRPPTAAE